MNDEPSSLEAIAFDLAVVVSALKLSRWKPNGIVAEEADAALAAYDGWADRENSVKKRAPEAIHLWARDLQEEISSRPCGTLALEAFQDPKEWVNL